MVARSAAGLLAVGCGRMGGEKGTVFTTVVGRWYVTGGGELPRGLLPMPGLVVEGTDPGLVGAAGALPPGAPDPGAEVAGAAGGTGRTTGATGAAGLDEDPAAS